jgi:hypothetical protein
MKEINVLELRELLMEQTVAFSYLKKDGTECLANGTINGNLIPDEFKSKDSSTLVTNLRYFDIDKGGWRSIAKEIELIKLL